MNYFGLAPLTRDLQTSRRSFLIGATALGSSLVVGFSAEADVAPAPLSRAQIHLSATCRSRQMTL